MIKIMLADDHDIMRAGLYKLLEETGDMTIVAEAADGNETVSKAISSQPDVLVLDITMPGLDGLEVVRQLRMIMPDLKIVILSMHEEEHCIVQALGSGAKGYVTKRSAPEDLVKAIRKVFAGGRFLSEKASEVLAFRVSLDSSDLEPLACLSSREAQVFYRLAKGQTTQEIATKLGVSDKTVSTYRSRLLQKLDLKNNVELALFAMRNRLIE